MLQKRDEKGRGYSDTYLRVVNTQLSAIFNHAVRNIMAWQKRHKDRKIPCRENAVLNERRVSEVCQGDENKTNFLYAFEILYSTEARVSELLVLTLSDFNFEN